MANSAMDLLYPVFKQAATDESYRGLWLITEELNLTHQPLCTYTSAKLSVISNRWDQAQAFQPGVASFSDFDFDAAPNSITDIYCAAVKERPLLNYLLNQSAHNLPTGGRLFIAGEKSQGIKSIAKNAKPLFGHSQIEKHGALYLVTLTKTQEKPLDTPSKQLDDKHYPQTRAIGTLGSLTLFSKPGVFGWDKIDPGSELLVQYLTEQIEHFRENSSTTLDLGCGYGYLTAAAANLGFTNLYATDNNAAAISAINETAKRNHFAVTAWPDDIGSNATQAFDLVLCNPPFHQGFDHAKELSARFAQALSRLTKAHGKALVVVNQFINFETLCQSYFKTIRVKLANKSFKVIELSKT